ncbi:MAG: trypsin-like serine protease [Oligoflexales bacterium]|nr:trypsin-like serine protease [Oligoflexales bacterium]
MKTKLTKYGAMATCTIVTLSCGAVNDGGKSRLDVTNGIPISESDYPSVVMLVLDGAAICTGTFISDSRVLTAGHCVRSVGKVQIYRRKGAGGFQAGEAAKSFITSPMYKESGYDPKYDIAIVNFPSGTSKYISRISQSDPRPGDKFTIVGYGNSVISPTLVNGQLQQTGATYKREGFNEVSSVEEGQILFEGYFSQEDAEKHDASPGEKAGAAGGDSGGPMFNTRGEIIGTTSHGKIKSDANSNIIQITTSYVDLSSEYSRDFLSNYF